MSKTKNAILQQPRVETGLETQLERCTHNFIYTFQTLYKSKFDWQTKFSYCKLSSVKIRCIDWAIIQIHSSSNWALFLHSITVFPKDMENRRWKQTCFSNALWLVINTSSIDLNRNRRFILHFLVCWAIIFKLQKFQIFTIWP